MTNSDRRVSPTPPAHYRAGSGEPLVLLHGATSTWRCWESVLPALVDRYDVFAPNLPGHAGQPGVRPLTIDGMVAAVEAAMDDAGFGTAHIVGNSLGGWGAMELARRGRARSVVALAPAGGWAPAEIRVPALFHSMRRSLQLGLPALPTLMRVPVLRRNLLRLVCEHGDRLTTEQALVACYDALTCTLIDDLPRPIVAQTEPYGDLGIPVLISWGTSDRLLTMPRYSDPWRKLVPTATWHTNRGVGHVPMFDDPDLVANTIIDWVTRASAQRKAS
ncbi:alpha/beta fold hydrolase [Nocardia sp. XZ_19_385]|uniref:alpha/beta fold hydrolase n=1 Tax=Nocardia sp. XZ_19_385 TaxID=2769488 RepID=UPI00188F3ACA|nr:alpha/beta hydrolase [Nocardia sp. XZ_19_385]